MTEQNKTKVPAELIPAGNYPVVSTDAVMDKQKGKTQEEVNEQVDADVEALQQADTNLQEQITAEASRASAKENSLDNRLSTVEELAEISVEGGTIGIASSEDFTNRTPAGDAKIPTVGAVLGGADDVPTPGSDKLVKSGGVKNELVLGAVYDVSAKNPTAGPNSDGKFTSISALLSDTNINTLIPIAVRKGGMSIKFVQSSDNKYVQYRLKTTSFSTVPNDWINVEENVEQLTQQVSEISNVEAANTDEVIKITTEDEQTVLLEITANGVDAKNLKSNGVEVLTSHQDISNLATKTELQEGLAGKQDVIEEISIDDTHVSEEEAQIWASDNYDEDNNVGERYAQVDEDGVKAKSFYLLDGSPVAKDSLYGKKWAPLGDSFTAGATNNTLPDGKYKGQKKVYPYFIGNRTGIDVISTFFASGRTLAWPANPGTFTNSICNPNAACYYQNIPVDVDYITIYLGINDSHHAPGDSGGDGEDNTGEIPIGTITDNTTSTYYGAWNVILSWLIENRPFAHIGIIVSNGCGRVEYRTAQIEIARKYGVPFIDLNGDDRTPFMLRAVNSNIPSAILTKRLQVQAVDYDGTQTGTENWHPNDNAHLFESWFIENFIRTI